MLSRYTINCMRGVGLADLNPRKQLPADEYWYYGKLCCLHRSLNFTHAFWQHCVDGFELRGAPRHCTLHSYSSTLRAITYSCGASSPDIFHSDMWQDWIRQVRPGLVCLLEVMWWYGHRRYGLYMGNPMAHPLYEAEVEVGNYFCDTLRLRVLIDRK